MSWNSPNSLEMAEEEKMGSGWKGSRDWCSRLVLPQRPADLLSTVQRNKGNPRYASASGKGHQQDTLKIPHKVTHQLPINSISMGTARSHLGGDMNLSSRMKVAFPHVGGARMETIPVGFLT